MFGRIVLLFALVGCVQGTEFRPEEVIPPRVVSFSATPQGWCGDCADVTVSWEVESMDAALAVQVDVSFRGATVQTLQGLKGSQVVKVCGGSTPPGGSGVVALTVPGLANASPPVSLQQTIDGEVRLLDFQPMCPYNGAWSDEVGFTELLYPSDVKVREVLNWTFYDTNGNGAKDPGEATPKIKLTHAPLTDFVAEESWKGLDPPVTLHGKWSAVPENIDLIGKRCPAEGVPVTPAEVIPLGAQVRLVCAP